MYKFRISINQGGQEFRDEDTRWIFQTIQNIIEYSKLSEAELATYTELISGNILQNYVTGQTYLKTPAAPLSATTIRKKGHSRIFEDTGKLLQSLLTQKIPNGYEIYIAEDRAQIAYWLNTGTSRMPDRPAFGIMPETAESILQQLLLRPGRRRRAA